MSNFYDERSASINVGARNERGVSGGFPFSYDLLPSIPAGSKAGTSLDAPTSHGNSGAESRLPSLTSYEQSFTSPSASSQELPTRRPFSSTFMRESFSEMRFHQSNSFSAPEGHLTPLAMAGQDNMHIANATGSAPHLSPYGNSGATTSFAASPLSDANDPWYGASNSYFSANGDTPVVDRCTHGYAEDFNDRVESWSSDSPLMDRKNNLDGVTEPAMFSDPDGQISRFSNREETLPISSMGSSRCQECNSPLISDSFNHYQLHYWHEHPPPASSPQAWKSQRCIWNSCPLEKEFSTPKSWVDHAFNVHYPRFWCPWEGCTWPKPFGTQNLVNRHIGTKHEPPKNCQIPGCQGRRNKIDRKDKKDEHNGNYHGPLVCDVTGCPRGCIGGQNHGFTKEADLDKHFKNKHKHLRSQKFTTRA